MSARTFDEAEPLRLRIDRVSEASDSVTLYCTDEERTQVSVALTDDVDVRPEQWYEFDGVTLADSAGGPTFRLPPSAGQPSGIESPTLEDTSDTAAGDPPVVQLGDRTDRLGIAVTVVPTGEGPPTPTAPDRYEVTAVCLDAFGTATEPAVYHRAAEGNHDERLLLEHAVEDLSDAAASTLVAWRRDADPLALLAARHEWLRDGDLLDSGIGDVLGDYYYADLSRVGVRTDCDDLVSTCRSLGVAAAYPRVDPEALERTPSEWRAEWDYSETPLTDRTDTRMIGRDYRALLDAHLTDDTTTPDELASCLQQFASAPLDPLASLSDHATPARLGCVRLSETELDAL